MTRGLRLRRDAPKGPVDFHLRDIGGSGHHPAGSLPKDTPSPEPGVVLNAPEPATGDASRRQLGDVLVERGLITPFQLSEALARQQQTGKRIGQTLVDMGLIGERALAGALGEQYGLPIVDLRSETSEPAAVSLVPEELARSNAVLPVSLRDGVLRVVVADPGERLRLELAALTGYTVEFSLAPITDIHRAIDSLYRAFGGVPKLVEAFEASESRAGRSATPQRPEQLANDAPVVQVVDKILLQAVRDRASDVHIEPEQSAVRVRYRVDGALKDVLLLPANMGLGLISRIKILAEMNIVDRRRPQDGQFSTLIDDQPADVRVSTVATIWGEKCVLRILDKTRSLLYLSDLGMTPDTHERFSHLIRAPFGMVLCAGPTGSGKTTTLYAALSELNDPTRNVMTIEDPVEYVFPRINQIQTNEAAGLSFETGLRSILRQDPDIILVGEIRDVETARIAVQSALTGHFVLSSVHATDAVSALHRFLDMGIESFLVASSLVAIVGQRLVRRICTSCAAPYQPSTEELAFYRDSGGPEKSSFVAGQGCNLCGGTGYHDRVGVYELLKMTPEIARLVVGWATQDELQRLAKAQGMRSLRDEAVELVARDMTTISEVIRSIYAV